jgi:acetylornithine/succinyldiaminopimelate/putrescine aminotransferase
MHSKEQTLTLRKKYLGPSLSLAYNEHLKIVKGKGQYLYDENGREYLDCVNNISHVGHCHPAVIQVAHEQNQLLNTNTRYLHDNIIELAEKLTSKLPVPLSVCYFVNSGSEANELALRMAAEVTRNNNTIVLDHAYHGNTSSLINISPYKFNGKGGMGKQEQGGEVVFADGKDTDAARVVAEGVDAAVVVVGLTWADEGEWFVLQPEKKAAARRLKFIGGGGDRTSLRLRARDEALIAEVAAVQPRTVVVCVGGSAVDVSWREQVAAILF